MSFVVPVRNGAASIREALEAVERQADGRPMEIIVVDDGSDDGSAAILEALAATGAIRLLAGPRRGAAAAINTGVRAARHPIICQVDQDVIVGPGWMRALAAELDDPTVGAAQGYYTTDRSATTFARAMGFDLEQRYGAIAGPETGHVCTGNVAYRAEALRRIGLFDETFGYGYDNDVSYRLRSAGYRLTMRRDARSVHRWREGLRGYFVQQYGFGYGRLDLVAKHPRRATGDSVSPSSMMAHPLLMTAASAALAIAALSAIAGRPSRLLVVGAVLLVGGLAIERCAAGLAAAVRFRDATPLLFPFVHVARDLAWVAAIVMWSVRRLAGRPARPSYSMSPRPGRVAIPRLPRKSVASDRVLGLIPAHNEAANLQAVVREIRACRPDIDLLIVDDGSTDETMWLVEELGVRWLRFPERLGVGSAMRAGLRYAARLGYDAVVRLDGDGQHRAADVGRLLEPIRRGEADVAVGSRYTDAANAFAPQGVVRGALAVCLSALTGRRVTDPTSGFCALGPRAVRVLAEHHPTGYAEPELQLFLSRNALRTVEVAVAERRRLSGTTSLTAGRLTKAAARVLLAMIIVPLRHRVVGLAGD